MGENDSSTAHSTIFNGISMSLWNVHIRANYSLIIDSGTTRWHKKSGTLYNYKVP